jgi:hypothetical protein
MFGHRNPARNRLAICCTCSSRGGIAVCISAVGRSTRIARHSRSLTPTNLVILEPLGL